jgi:hypothetical protein
MKNRPSKASRGTRQVPLDHLRPGARPRNEADDEGRSEGAPSNRPDNVAPAQPAEPATPGAGDSDATRGKATRSPAAVAERPHLEGSEQGPA